jgi:hypothetical protein
MITKTFKTLTAMPSIAKTLGNTYTTPRRRCLGGMRIGVYPNAAQRTKRSRIHPREPTSNMGTSTWLPHSPSQLRAQPLREQTSRRVRRTRRGAPTPHPSLRPHLSSFLPHPRLRGLLRRWHTRGSRVRFPRLPLSPAAPREALPQVLNLLALLVHKYKY